MFCIFSPLTIIIYLILKTNLCFLVKKNNTINPLSILLKFSKTNRSNHNPKNAHIKLFIYNIDGDNNRKGKICLAKKKYVRKKKNIVVLFDTSNFFNPKQFKDLFPYEEAKKKTKNDNQEGVDLEKVENLKEICPELYAKLIDYNRLEEEEEEEEEEKEEKAKSSIKLSKELKSEKQRLVDSENVSVHHGLPLLMVDGKDFQGFADSRKIRIKPRIATQFDNLDYNEFITSVKYEKSASGGEAYKQKESSVAEKPNNDKKNATKNITKIEHNKDYSTNFEKNVRYLLDERKKQAEGVNQIEIKNEMDNQPKIKKSTEKENLSKKEQIEKYKKFGKYDHINSEIGEILYDRNYPGYIHFNHGMNIKELDEKNEFDSETPSYINPSITFLRTGRKREEKKKKDSGIKQKKRWNANILKNDIKRGKWKYYDDTIKDLNDSIDQEKLTENYYSNNYYQRTNYNTGYGDLEKVQNNYFDVQFIGSAETYPFNISVGMNFIWPINFIPLLCKQYTKRLGQPIKSPIFNLGGFDSLQLWFYPDGMNNSIDGYCALKLVMKPGSYLPVKIFLFAFSEYNYVHTSPFYKESADYVTSSLNLCQFLLKTKENLKNIENNRDYVILGPAGNVYIGLGIFDDTYDFDEDFKKFYSISDKYKKRKQTHKFKYKYDWDEGVHIFDNWLKKQTAITDDKNELLPVYYTHSDLYENYKYKYVPEKNPFKFLNKKRDITKWNRHPF